MSINLITGFDVGVPAPLDSREQVADLTARDAIPSGVRWEGMSVYVISEAKEYKLVGGLLDANWIEAGGSGGAGGGVSGTDTLFVQDFETAALGDFDQDGLVLSATDPIHGLVSAVVDHLDLGTQYFKQTIPLDEKFRGRNLTVKLTGISNATDGNVTVVMYDETNAAYLTGFEVVDFLSTQSSERYFRFDTELTTASISYTVTMLAEVTFPTTKIDDIEIFLTDSISNVFIQEEDFELEATGNAGEVVTANTTNIPFGTVSTTLRGDAGSWNGSEFTVLKDGVFSLSGAVYLTANANQGIELYVGGVKIRRLSYEQTSTSLSYFTHEAFFTAGSVISLKFIVTSTLNTTGSNDLYHYLVITRQGALKSVKTSSNQKVTLNSSQVRFEGATARGTGANTFVVKFTTLASIRGSGIEVDPLGLDTTYGTHVRMAKAGTLSVSGNIYLASAGQSAYISKNQAILTAAPTDSESMGRTYDSSSASIMPFSWRGDVAEGDIIRIVSSITPSATAGIYVNFHLQENDFELLSPNTGDAPNIIPVSQEITTLDVDWALGNVFYKDISTSETLTFSNISDGQIITVIIKNTSGSPVGITLPVGIYKDPSLDLAIDAGKENLYTFIRSNGKTYVSYLNKMEA